jgi:hypothetical protein
LKISRSGVEEKAALIPLSNTPLVRRACLSRLKARPQMQQ